MKNYKYDVLTECGLTRGASKLLGLISKYQNVFNVTNQQYAYLMGISRRNTIKYLNELEEKGRVEIHPANRRSGQGKANQYKVIESFQEDN